MKKACAFAQAFHCSYPVRSLFARFPAPQGVYGLDVDVGVDGVDRMAAGTGH